MNKLAQDFRYAFRQLRKAPGFATIAILTLALGIGATTAIFTLVYDVLLKPLPYPHPGQIVAIQEQAAEYKDLYPTLPVSASHFDFWQRHSHSFQALAAVDQETFPLGAGGHPLQVSVVRATSGIFPVLDVAPQLGRAFTAQDDQPGHERVVVLTHDLWQRQFQSDPNILGRTITLNGYPYTVIGVMPQSFHLPTAMVFGGVANMGGNMTRAQALIPMAFTKEQLQNPLNMNYFGLGRLRAGVTTAQANAELDALQHTISTRLPANEKVTLSAVLMPFQEYLVGDNSKSLLILLAAVAGLLLIGCINIMNLLLARALGRRQEMAIASAMGASRADLLRGAMREACLLAVLGGALGLLFATVAVPILQRYLPPALNFRGTLHIDWAGAAIAVLLAAGATLLAGAAPAWMSWRTQPQEALRSESRSASESRTGKRLRKTLVAAEVAVSVALVLLAGLLTTSVVRLMHVHRGFEVDKVLTATVDLPAKSYSKNDDRVAFYKRSLARLQQLPGVERVAFVSDLPLHGDSSISIMTLPGDTRPMTQQPTEHLRRITPGYFQTIHLPLIAGRFLRASDEGKDYASVSELTVKTLWPGKDPIGQQFRLAGNGAATKLDTFTVIGVVGNARTVSLAKPDPMMVYLPYWYRSDTTTGLVVRTKQDPTEMAGAIRKAIWSVDPEVAVPTVQTLSGLAANSVASRRFEMDLLLLFAVSALLLAGLGVYGVVTYSVVQRRQEIGLRMALGAQRSNIYAQVLREGLAPVAVGAVAGIVAAFGLARLIGSMLFDVSAYNPMIALGAAAVLFVVGIAACLLPARRAAAVDPMVALRNE